MVKKAYDNSTICICTKKIKLIKILKFISHIYIDEIWKQTLEMKEKKVPGREDETHRAVVWPKSQFRITHF